VSSLYATPLQTFVDFVKLIVCALFIALLIRTFVIQPYYIPSGSMLTTLQSGDRLFITKFSYGIHLPFVSSEILATGEPEIGDIIVFPYPENPDVDFVKRVVGLPGDTVEIRNKQLFRNGKPLQEPYISHTDPLIVNSVRDNMAPVTVPEGKVFVMGDNRDYSQDSRFWGFVDKTTIHGKALILYWSSENLFKVNWNRIGTLLR
jgi:signal peptidase I, bacterial type